MRLFIFFSTFLVIICLPLFSYSAYSNLDSLKRELLNDSNADSIRWSCAYDLGRDYRNFQIDSSDKYLRLALDYSKYLSKREVGLSLQSMAHVFRRKSQLDSAIIYEIKGLKLFEEINHSEGVSSSNINLGVIYKLLGEYSQSERHFKIAEKVCLQEGDSNRLSMTYENMGTLYAHTGKADTALHYLRRAFSIAKIVNDKVRIAWSGKMLGWQLHLMNRDREANEINFYILTLLDTEEFTFLEAAILNNIGVTYMGLSEFEKAMNYYHKSETLYQVFGVNIDLAGTWLNIGLLYLDMEKVDSSHFYLNKAEALFTKLNSRMGLIYVYNAYGRLFTYSVQLDSASKYLNKSLDIQGAEKNYERLTSLVGLARVEFDKNNFEQANTISKQIIQEAIALNSLINEVDGYEVLFKSEEELGNYKEAYEALGLYLLKKDSMNQEENQRSIIQREYQYQYEKAALADSLLAVEKTVQLQLAHHEEISAKNQTRNALIGGGLLVLILAGGGWSRARFVKKNNERLEKEKRRAEESEAFKQQFLANMSHEIRTPMNAILGMTNLTLDTALNPKQTAYLEGVKKSSENLLVIINDILDLSKLEAGGIELEDIAFDLHELLEQVFQTLHFKAEEKGLELLIQKSEDLAQWVMGDPTRLSQVLINLTGNAIKFTESGKVEIEVKLKNQQVYFAVKDTGVGIDPENQKKLFEAFKQADKSTTRKYGGTGLGLSIAQEFVQLMGGKIQIESTPGKGSSFSFELALDEAQPEESIKSSTDTTTLKGIRILLAEDNKYNQIVVVDTIANLVEGAQVDVANNGQEALEKVKSNNYDVILMDSDMPVMDGREATREIRKFNTELPIIALTASVLATEISRCLEAGMNDSIPKPFKRAEFFETIGKYYKPG